MSLAPVFCERPETKSQCNLWATSSKPSCGFEPLIGGGLAILTFFLPLRLTASVQFPSVALPLSISALCDGDVTFWPLSQVEDFVVMSTLSKTSSVSWWLFELSLTFS